MNFKRKRRISKTSHKCSMCGSQRRMFGWGDMKTQARMRILNRELRFGM